ncbi:MAG TPA: NfeD family protein [Acidobacteriota bacterium]|nr:NfeD family protein [Acidobacteriota bacterium]
MRYLLPLIFILSVSQPWAEILRVEIDGVIDPITSEFIGTSVDEAERAEAEFLLIWLSTPGGLGISMQEIVQTILNSKVPVVCYVTPKGAHAASAGFFILLAADVAVMAPGTNTGAAHPVFPFGMEDKVMLEKVKNDALASLRSIVNQRERNYELAEKGVLESASFTSQEALDGGLIDLIANDEADLLVQLEGREITRFTGERQVIQIQGQGVRAIEKTFRQKILSEIANPNFALILGVLGLLGLYLEFTHPGMIVPGVVGGICLLLALLGFSLLPISFIGVLLILLALGLFIAEVKVQGFGILGFGGIIAMVFGILLLVDSPYPQLRIGLGTALAVVIPFAAIVIFLLRLVIRSHLRKVTTGEAGLIGQIGVTRTGVGPEGGTVFVNGEIWRAVSDVTIPAGSRVRIVRAKNLDVRVEPVEGVDWI